MMDERTTQVRNKIMSEMAMLMYLFVAAAFAVQAEFQLPCPDILIKGGQNQYDIFNHAVPDSFSQQQDLNRKCRRHKQIHKHGHLTHYFISYLCCSFIHHIRILLPVPLTSISPAIPPRTAHPVSCEAPCRLPGKDSA